MKKKPQGRGGVRMRVTINGVAYNATNEQIQRAFELLVSPNAKEAAKLVKALEPAPAVGRPSCWTDEQAGKVIDLRDAGNTWDAIAAAVGLSRSTVIKIWNTRGGK